MKITTYESAAFIARQKLSFNVFYGMPKAQREGVIRVIQRQGADKLQGASKELCGPAIMLGFGHIVIGVEMDGHAHS